jgi:hypothetical protein
LNGSQHTPAVAGAALAFVCLLVALTAARSAPIPFALLLLGTIYSVSGGERAVAVPIFASALLLVAELAYWSIDERVHQRLQPGVLKPRLYATLAVAAAAIPASAVVLVAAEADVPRSPATTAAGAVAIVACLALLTLLAGRRSVKTSPKQGDTGVPCAAGPAP